MDHIAALGDRDELRVGRPGVVGLELRHSGTDPGGFELRRGLALKKRGDVDVLIELRPVHTPSGTNGLPIRALLRSAFPKTRIPFEGYADRPSVLQIYEEALVRYSDVFDSVLRVKVRSIHSKRPSVEDDAC